jgi:hypothetical protein
VQVNQDRGSGTAEFVGKLLCADQGITADKLNDSEFAIGEAHAYKQKPSLE